jgi:hypothetical protein
MKKVIFGLLSLIGVAFTSCQKDEVSTSINQEAIEQAPSFETTTTAKKTITAKQLKGKFELKYANTKADRNWKAQKSVGLDFFPDTFYYSVGILNFNSTTGEVEILSKSTVANLPDTTFGSLKFKVNGASLKIILEEKAPDSPFNGDFKVNALTSKWLILEDVRTGTGWAFLKS